MMPQQSTLKERELTGSCVANYSVKKAPGVSCHGVAKASISVASFEVCYLDLIGVSCQLPPIAEASSKAPMWHHSNGCFGVATC